MLCGGSAQTAVRRGKRHCLDGDAVHPAGAAERRGLGGAEPPLALLLALAVLLGVAFLSPLCRNRCEQYYVRASKAGTDANRLFAFCLWDIALPERSADVRLYCQDRLVEHYGKDETFLPGGPLSRLAKGPLGLWAGAGAAVSGVFTGLAYAFVCLKAWAGPSR